MNKIDLYDSVRSHIVGMLCSKIEHRCEDIVDKLRDLSVEVSTGPVKQNDILKIFDLVASGKLKVVNSWYVTEAEYEYDAMRRGDYHDKKHDEKPTMFNPDAIDYEDYWADSAMLDYRATILAGHSAVPGSFNQMETPPILNSNQMAIIIDERADIAPITGVHRYGKVYILESTNPDWKEGCLDICSYLPLTVSSAIADEAVREYIRQKKHEVLDEMMKKKLI